MYSTGIWGVFGATVAAGKLLGFDEATLQSALGTAGSHGAFPPGGLQANHAMVKEDDRVERDDGCLRRTAGSGRFPGTADFLDYSGRWDTSALVAGLGEPGRYAIHDTYFKPYAVCRWAHASVDAVLELKHRHDLRIEEIESIKVDTFWEVTRLANDTPSNTIAAQFSIQFALAVALLYDRISPAEVSDAHIRDPAVLALARKVEVAVDDALDRQFPAKTMARVTMRTRGGELRDDRRVPARKSGESALRCGAGSEVRAAHPRFDQRGAQRPICARRSAICRRRRMFGTLTQAAPVRGAVGQ